jgi:hypothetical protein
MWTMGLSAILAGYGMAQGNAPETAAPAAPPITAAQIQALLPKTWVDSVTFKGDLRYRYETVQDDSALNAAKETYTRQRDRVRARLSAEAKCNDNLKATIGLSTGGLEPMSGNQTIGDGANKKDMRLDLANVDYSFFGDSPNELHAIAGKMKNPFMAMNDDLIWDPDVTPEGLALKGQANAGMATFYGNGGMFWLQERSNKSDLKLYAGQGAVKLTFIPEAALTLGASYHQFAKTEGADLVDWEGKGNPSAYNNSTMKGSISGNVTNKAYTSDFSPVMYFAQLDVWAAGLPIAVFAQQLSNTDVDNFDQGLMYGVSLGKAKNPRTFEVGYTHAKLEKDATFGMWTDSDRWNGGTDGEGHKVYAKYQIMKNLQVGATYFKDDKIISDAAKTKDYERLQLDLVAAF